MPIEVLQGTPTIDIRIEGAPPNFGPDAFNPLKWYYTYPLTGELAEKWTETYKTTFDTEIGRNSTAPHFTSMKYENGSFDPYVFNFTLWVDMPAVSSSINTATQLLSEANGLQNLAHPILRPGINAFGPPPFVRISIGGRRTWWSATGYVESVTTSGKLWDSNGEPTVMDISLSFIRWIAGYDKYVETLQQVRPYAQEYRFAG